jgi:hypothetical protein
VQERTERARTWVKRGKYRNVGQAAVALATSVERRRWRSRQREVGWPSDEETVLYAEQRRIDLPPGHPYV